MILTIRILQALCTVSWLVPVCVFWRSAFSLFMKDAELRDMLRSAVCVTAASILIFNFRWLFYSQQINSLDTDTFPLWMVAYIICIIAGQSLYIVAKRV